MSSSRPGGHHTRSAKDRPAVRCHGVTKDGKPCGKWAMHGQQVCDTHGGRAPRPRKVAVDRIAEEQALRELARLNVPAVGNALIALQQHAGIVVAWRDRCAAMVNRLTDEAIRYEGTTTGEQLRSEVALWERSLDRATQTLASLARAHVDERLARIDEAKADMLATAFSLALRDAGISGEQADRVRKRFVMRLRVIPGEAA